MFADSGDINLRVKYILVQSDGELHAGSQTCPYRSQLDITLVGRSDDTDGVSNSDFGRKFIGVAPTGTAVFYGRTKLARTYLITTITTGTLDASRPGIVLPRSKRPALPLPR